MKRQALALALMAITVMSLMAGVEANTTDLEVTLQLTGLPTLSNGHYEGWLVVGGTPVSMGNFQIAQSGQVQDLNGKAISSFKVKKVDLDKATSFFISIEPATGGSGAPSAARPLSGALAVDKKSVPLAQNLGVSLQTASGGYILETPTNDHAVEDYDLAMNFTGLTHLNSGYYEVWLELEEHPNPAGKFNIDSAGHLTDLSGNVLTSPFIYDDLDAPDMEECFITIEAAGSPGTVPSNIKPLASEENEGALSGALGQDTHLDFSAAAGSYVLETPTNGPNSSELSGAWFMDLSSGTPAASLTLPDTTGTNWTYEGWANIGGTLVSMGRFDKPSGADSSNAYSGNLTAPLFPGEDFLKNAPTGLTFPTDLSGKKVAVTVEPRVDNDPSPFFFTPLSGNVPSAAVNDTKYTLTRTVATFPTGTFHLTQRAPPPSNELSGVWFLDPDSGTPVASLHLPDLTGTDWTYEGWAVLNGTAVSTGRFDKPTGSDTANTYGSFEVSPSFPGEDFLQKAPTGLTFPTTLAGQKVAVSIVPKQGPDPGMNLFKVLTGDVPASAKDHVLYQLTASTNTFPSGTATIKEVSSGGLSSGMMLWAGIAIVVIIVIVVLAVFLMRGRSKPSS